MMFMFPIEMQSINPTNHVFSPFNTNETCTEFQYWDFFNWVGVEGRDLAINLRLDMLRWFGSVVIELL